MKKDPVIYAVVDEIYAGRIHAYFDHDNVRYFMSVKASKFVPSDRFKLRTGHAFKIGKSPYRIYEDARPIFIQNREWWKSRDKASEIFNYLKSKWT